MWGVNFLFVLVLFNNVIIWCEENIEFKFCDLVVLKVMLVLVERVLFFIGKYLGKRFWEWEKFVEVDMVL